MTDKNIIETFEKIGTFEKAIVANKQRKPPKSFSDAIGGGDFHTDLPRIEFKAIVDMQIIVHDCELIEDFQSVQYGAHDCLLLHISVLPDDVEYTTITSAFVVMKRVLKAKKLELLPLLGKITYTGKYYNIL